MFVLLGIAFCGLLITAGIVFIYGTIQEWPLLVDPPEDLWTFYSQAFIKKVFGKKGLRVHNFLLGTIFIIFGLLGLWNGLRQE